MISTQSTESPATVVPARRGPLNTIITLIFALTLILLPTISVLSSKGVVPAFVILSLCALFHARMKTGHWPWWTGMEKGVMIGATLIVWMGLSALWSPAPEQALNLTIRLFVLIACGFILAQSLKNSGTGERVLRLLLVGFPLGVLVLVLENQADAPLTELLKDEQIQASSFNFGTVFVTALGWFLLAQFNDRLSTAMRLAALGGLVVMPFLSESESAQVASLLALCWFLLWHFLLVSEIGVMKGWKFLKISLKSLVFLIFITMPLLAFLLWHNIGPTVPNGLAASAHHRLFIWDSVAQLIPDNPLIGAGFDASRHENRTEDGKAPLYPGVIPLHPHNAALQIWYELGAVGILIALAGVNLMLDRLSKPNRTHRTDTIMLPDALISMTTVTALDTMNRGNGEKIALRQCGFIFLLVIAMLSWGLWQNRWFTELAFFAVLLTIPQKEKDPSVPNP